MTTREKAQWLTAKVSGAGVSVQTLANYCDYHYSTISHYINDDKEANLRLEKAVERGINQWYCDIKHFMESNNHESI